MVDAIRMQCAHTIPLAMQSDAIARQDTQTLAQRQLSFARVRRLADILRLHRPSCIVSVLRFQIVAASTTVDAVRMQTVPMIQQRTSSCVLARLVTRTLARPRISSAQVNSFHLTRPSSQSNTINILSFHLLRHLPGEEWWMRCQCDLLARWNNKCSEMHLQDRLHQQRNQHQWHLHR